MLSVDCGAIQPLTGQDPVDGAVEAFTEFEEDFDAWGKLSEFDFG